MLFILDYCSRSFYYKWHDLVKDDHIPTSQKQRDHECMCVYFLAFDWLHFLLLFSSGFPAELKVLCSVS